MSEFIQVLTSIDSRERAEEISRKLLEMRLAACVQIIGPVKSMYWWRGVIEESNEWLCFIKTRGDLYKQVEEMIRSLHGYEVPEIIVLPIIQGFYKYLEWMSNELKK